MKHKVRFVGGGILHGKTREVDVHSRTIVVPVPDYFEPVVRNFGESENEFGPTFHEEIYDRVEPDVFCLRENILR